MNTLTLILFACGVFICSVAIVFWKKGFWPGLAGTCALPGPVSLYATMWRHKGAHPPRRYGSGLHARISFLSEVLFWIITSEARPLKFYSPKSGIKSSQSCRWPS